MPKWSLFNRGFCVKEQKFVSLIPENMSDELIGFEVTIGLNDPERTATESGKIIGYSDEVLSLHIGGKTKKFPYDPNNIVLKVYQFEKGVHFITDADILHEEKIKLKSKSVEKRDERTK